MELIIALYTTHLPFEPQLVGWWGLWFLRIALPGLPAACLAVHLLERRSLKRTRTIIKARLGL